MADRLDNYPSLQQILPDAYEYRVSMFKDCSQLKESDGKQEGPVTKFETTIRLQLKNKAEAKAWIKDMEKTSAVTWRVDKTYPVCGGKKTQNIYRIDMRCQHRTYSRSSSADRKPSSKNTCCPAKMFLVVKRTHMASGKLSQSTDEHLQEFPTRVYLDFRHNHHLLSPESLAKRDVSEETVQRLTDLFVAGHTPLSALEEIKRDLQADYGDQFVFVSGDRSKCPDKQFCYRLYYKLFYPKYPKSLGRQKLLDLQKYLKPFCDKYESHCTSIEETVDDNIIIAICTPQKRKVDNENGGGNKDIEHISVTPIVEPLDTDIVFPHHLHFLHNTQADEARNQAVRQCQDGLRDVFDNLMSKVESSPDHFLRSMEEFTKTYQGVKKDQELMNALEMFGKFPGVIGALTRTMKQEHSHDNPEKTTIICAKRKKERRRHLITGRPYGQESLVSQHICATSYLPATSRSPATLPTEHEVPPYHTNTHDMHTHMPYTHKLHTLHVETNEDQAVNLDTQTFEIHESHIASDAENDVPPEKLRKQEETLISVVGEHDMAVVEEVTVPQPHHTNHHEAHHPSHPHIAVSTSLSQHQT